ncbi:MAG TPA: hypothetical protein V6D19_10860 [Stenomitos sp.]
MTKLTNSQRYRKDPSKYSLQLAKAFVDGFTRSAIEDVFKIKARLHRIALFYPSELEGPDDLYGFFKGLFSNLSYNPKKLAAKRLIGFKNQLVIKTTCGTLSVFIHRIKDEYPLFIIELVPKDDATAKDLKTFLTYINVTIPGLETSKIEYAIDLFCRKPNEVENLYMMIKRSLYTPYKNEPEFYEHDPLPDSVIGSRMNSTYYAKKDVLKVYERGNDHNKISYVHKGRKTKGWRFKDLNRVRLEYTASRPDLVKHEIVSLTDLLTDCKIYHLNKNLYDFRFFKTKNLPKYWDWPSYSTVNNKNQNGTFLLEYAAPRQLKNVRQCVAKIPEFQVLKKRMLAEMMKMESEWRVTEIKD